MDHCELTWNTLFKSCSVLVSDTNWRHGYRATFWRPKKDANTCHLFSLSVKALTEMPLILAGFHERFFCTESGFIVPVWVSGERMNINCCITSENWHMWKVCTWATLCVGWRKAATSVNSPPAIRRSLMFYVRVKNHAVGANLPHSAYSTFRLLMLDCRCWDDDTHTLQNTHTHTQNLVSGFSRNL